MDQNAILTIQEVAEYLRVSERTIYDWATKGKIPSGKLSGIWRFKRSEIEKWVDKNLGVDKISTTPSSVDIKSVLTPERILIFDSANKEQTLNRLIDTLTNESEVQSKKELTKEIFEREKLMSTGIGLGIGIPHVRLDNIKTVLMAVVISKTEINDYDSLDDEPVRIVCMIVAGKNQHALYIKTVAAISQKLKEEKLRKSLLRAKDNTAVFKILT